MKSFRDIAESYQENIEEAKFKKVKKWKANDNGELKKVIVKQCQDSEGKKVPGYKVEGGSHCKKMSPAEIKLKKKSVKKSLKTKKKHAGKIKVRAAKIAKKRAARGL